MHPRLTRASFALTSLAAFLFAITLAAAPGWHTHLHADAANAQHECAVTVVGSGKFQLGDAAPAVRVPIGSTGLTTVATLRPQWVPSLFHCASIFEHAPPVFS
jgi:hypothetical protein